MQKPVHIRGERINIRFKIRTSRRARGSLKHFRLAITPVNHLNTHESTSAIKARQRGALKGRAWEKSPARAKKFRGSICDPRALTHNSPLPPPPAYTRRTYIYTHKHTQQRGSAGCVPLKISSVKGLSNTSSLWLQNCVRVCAEKSERGKERERGMATLLSCAYMRWEI